MAIAAIEPSRFVAFEGGWQRSNTIDEGRYCDTSHRPILRYHSPADTAILATGRYCDTAILPILRYCDTALCPLPSLVLKHGCEKGR
eukprot:gene16581-biopygen10167